MFTRYSFFCEYLVLIGVVFVNNKEKFKKAKQECINYMNNKVFDNYFYYHNIEKAKEIYDLLKNKETFKTMQQALYSEDYAAHFGENTQFGMNKTERCFLNSENVKKYAELLC